MDRPMTDPRTEVPDLQPDNPDTHRTEPDNVREYLPGRTRTSSLKDVRPSGTLSGHSGKEKEGLRWR